MTIRSLDVIVLSLSCGPSCRGTVFGEILWKWGGQGEIGIPYGNHSHRTSNRTQYIISKEGERNREKALSWTDSSPPFNPIFPSPPHSPPTNIPRAIPSYWALGPPLRIPPNPFRLMTFALPESILYSHDRSYRFICPIFSHTLD